MNLVILQSYRRSMLLLQSWVPAWQVDASSPVLGCLSFCPPLTWLLLDTVLLVWTWYPCCRLWCWVWGGDLDK